MKAADPVRLDDLLEVEATPAVVQEATDRIMAAIVAIVEELRGGQAPAERFDPLAAGVTAIGNPNKRVRRKDQR